MTWKLLWASVAAAVVAFSIAGCDESPSTQPTQPSPEVTVETFSGTLPKDGTVFYSFTVPQQGTVTFTLLSLKIGGVASDLSVSMGLGVPSGIICNASSMSPVTASATPAISNPVTPAVYCVNVHDVGTLTADATFTINITRPK